MESTISFVTELSLDRRIESAVLNLVRLIEQGYALCLTLSSGKDSTTTTLLGLEAIRRVHAAGMSQPTHFISSSSTGVENPEIENSLLIMHDDISNWAHALGLPIDAQMVEPYPAASFVVNVLGRGTLPRFIENGAKHRTCTTDWKVKPQQRLAKQLREKSIAAGFKETISVLGTRLDESLARGIRMRNRKEQASEPVRNQDGYLTLSPICDWSEGDVWDFLAMFLDQELAPFDAFAKGDTVRRMLDLYRDGNEGTCGIFMDDGKKKPCGSRFGCSVCTLTGDADKSMESLLNSDPRYEYMRGLNEFRNFLVATQWDMSRRETVGRSISPIGYLPIRPDLYNLAMRKELLGYLLTIDQLEIERAERLDGDICVGLVESTPENERMRYPQFQLVSFEALVLIDFFWGTHHFASEAFPALRIWHDIAVLGRRRKIPKLATLPALKIQEKRWMKVDAWNAEVPTDGLRDYNAEMWNKYRHPEREATHCESHGEKVVWHEQAEMLSVDKTNAMMFVEEFGRGPLFHHSQAFTALDSTRFWLNEGIVKIAKGQIYRYHNMAARGQYFANLIERFNLIPQELDAFLTKKSISSSEHNFLLSVHGFVDTSSTEETQSIEEEDDGHEEELSSYNVAALVSDFL